MNLLDELKARLLSVIDSYKELNKNLPEQLKNTSTPASQPVAAPVTQPQQQQTTAPANPQPQQQPAANTQPPAANTLPDNSAAVADFTKKFGSVAPSAKAQDAKSPKQLEALKQQMANMNAAAQKHGVNPALVAAIMSRETGAEQVSAYKSLKEFGITPAAHLATMQTKLKGQGAEAHQISTELFNTLATSPLSAFPGLNENERCWGDNAHGYGPMQLDWGYQSSKILKVLMKSTPAERDTAAIDESTGVLAGYIKQMKRKFPQATEAQQLQAAMAAYNKGPAIDINNPDSGTSGGDYSKDVVERMFVLQSTDLFKGGSAPANTQQPAANTQQPATNNQQPAQPAPAAKTLSGSVGEGGANKEADVLLVKSLLNKFGAGLDPANANCGPKTIEAIKKFQSEKAGFSNPDGLISPNGQTWKALNGQPSSNPQPQPNGNQQQPAGNGNGAKPGWLSKAESHKGLKERDPKNYETINNFFKACGLKFGDGGIVSPTETAWCAAFVSWCLKNSGTAALTGYPGVRALEYAKYGQATKDGKPAFGCIGVMSHGHVGFVVGRNGDNIALLGGNQNQEVNISNYSISKFSAFRFPAGYNAPAEAYNLNGVEAGEGGSTR